MEAPGLPASVPLASVRALRAHFARLPGSAETFPFGPDVLVLKVGGKVYALLSLNSAPLRLSLKCDPLRAEGLRATHAGVTPGYHLNKRHWNTLTLGGAGELPLPPALVDELIEHSYALVVASLTRAARAALAAGADSRE